MNPTLVQLLWSFLQIGLFSFGGGYATIPLIQEQVIQLHQWLTLQEFTDIITISQMTPGPIAVNTSTFVGIQTAGFLGAIVATFGCILSGFVISICLYKFFQKHRSNPYIQKSLLALKASSCGLIAASASTILLLAFCGISTIQLMNVSIDIFSVLLFCLCFYIIRKWKWNPVYLMLLSGFVGMLVYM